MLTIRDINFDLLSRVRGALAAKPDSFDMDVWFQPNGDLSRTMHSALSSAIADGVDLTEKVTPSHVYEDTLPTLPGELLPYLPAEEQEDWCGTTACIAGHAILLDRDVDVADLRSLVSKVYQQKVMRSTTGARDEAHRVLCLPGYSHCASALFDKGEWPWGHIEQNWTDEIDLGNDCDVAIRILDGMLKGEVRFHLDAHGNSDWDTDETGYEILPAAYVDSLVVGAETWVAPQMPISEPWAAPHIAAKVVEVHDDCLVLGVDESRNTLEPEDEDVEEYERRNYSWEGPMRFWRRNGVLVSSIGFSVSETQERGS